MKEVGLYAFDCEDCYVTTVLIPPFQKMPEAIVWGERIFFHRTDTRYIEGMAFYATVQR